MFDEIKKQDNLELLDKDGFIYTEGIELYKAFNKALSDNDRTRASRLAIKLDTWQNTLAGPQKRSYALLLAQEGLVSEALGEAIRVFDASIVKISQTTL